MGTSEEYREATAAAQASVATQRDEVFVFEVGGNYFAVPVEQLIEAVPSASMAPVPCAPPRIAGSIAYHQTIIGVLDLRNLLELGDDSRENNGWILVLRPLERQCGLLVDGMIGMSPGGGQIRTEDNENTPEGSIFLGQITRDEQPVLILDVDTLTGVE